MSGVVLDSKGLREFEQLMNVRKAKYVQTYGLDAVNLTKVPLPTHWGNQQIIDYVKNTAEANTVGDDGEILYQINKRDIVHIRGISEEYYDKLNETKAEIWTGDILRRKFGIVDVHTKEIGFLKDKKTGEVIIEKLSRGGSVAILSHESINVPYYVTKGKQHIKYTPKEEGFDYIDYIEEEGIRKYLYLIPKSYCYKCRQTALVLAENKGSFNFYYGRRLPFRIGDYFRLLVIPYKPSDTNRIRGCRYITTKCSLDYEMLMKQLEMYWIQNGIVFNPQDCQIAPEIAPNRSPFFDLISNTQARDCYEEFDSNKPMTLTDDTLLFMQGTNEEGE